MKTDFLHKLKRLTPREQDEMLDKIMQAYAVIYDERLSGSGNASQSDPEPPAPSSWSN